MQVRELPPGDLLAGLKGSAGYAQGLWVRLNGGGKSSAADALPIELPKPKSSKVRAMTADLHQLRNALHDDEDMGMPPHHHCCGCVVTSLAYCCCRSCTELLGKHAWWALLELAL